MQRKSSSGLRLKIGISITLLVLTYFVLVYKFATFDGLNDVSIFLAYSIVVSVFTLSKYVLAIGYSEKQFDAQPEVWPTVSVIIPAYNEGSALYETIKNLSFSCYPNRKMNLVVVNDGSKDDTIDHANRAKKDFGQFLKIHVIDLEENVGKRECMYLGLESTSSEHVVFIDSDSRVDRNCVKELIRPLVSNEKIAGVSGHAYVLNASRNRLTQMQEVRYFNAFRTYKASESVAGYVSCCSGCCSAYRRSALDKIKDKWVDQSFLGQKCTYGDDRSLTNLLLKNGFKCVYNSKAKSYTNVPDTYRKYVKQQLRWKKSWVRESIITLGYVVKKGPWFFTLNVLNIVLPLLSPFIIFRYLFWYVRIDFGVTVTYILSMLIIAMLVGLYYKVNNRSGTKWLAGSIVFQLVNLTLFWQIPYAILSLRDTSWGTR